MFSHGWPLSADDWDAQMLFFLQQGYRVIAHDRRGHGRSSQTSAGHDMDTYADDLAALTEQLDLQRRDPRRPLDRRRRSGALRRAATAAERVAKAVLISAVPPLMAQDRGQSRRPADGGVRRHPRRRGRPTAPQFFQDFTLPFYGFNRPGAKISEGIREHWWRQGMMGAIKAHYDGIKAFSETDFTEDLKKIDVPTLVMHGDDDQIVPIADLGAAVGQAAQERDAEGLPRLSARHVRHQRGRDQPRPAGVLQGLRAARGRHALA